MFCALMVNAQKKFNGCQKVIISDSLKVRVYTSEKNYATFPEKNAGVKFKKGVLRLYRLRKMQMDVDGRTVSKTEEGDIIIDLYLTKEVQNILITDCVSMKLEDNFKTDKIIIKAENNSVIKGQISAQAFGLFLKSGSEAYTGGTFRTVKFTADSSKIELTDFQAENSEFVLSGGSEISVEGKTVKSDLTVSGLSRFEALRLSSQNSSANISGNSDVFFNVSKTLKINISDRSHVVLTGNPKILEENVGANCKFSRR
jgi:hypothetical protein